MAEFVRKSVPNARSHMQRVPVHIGLFLHGRAALRGQQVQCIADFQIHAEQRIAKRLRPLCVTRAAPDVPAVIGIALREIAACGRFGQFDDIQILKLYRLMVGGAREA